MKGNVKIELFDKENNLVKSVEDHNMLTTALDKLFTPVGLTRGVFADLNCGGLSTTYNFLHYFFGTLLLFDDVLTDDPEEFTPPKANTVGMAKYGKSYSAATMPIMGSFNEVESGWQADGSFKYVYDFATNQANGEISSLGLSNIECCGMGVDELDTSVVIIQSTEKRGTATAVAPRLSDDANCIPLYADYDNNLIVSVLRDNFNNSKDNYIGKTNKLKIALSSVPLSKFLFGDGYGYNEQLPIKEIKDFNIQTTLGTSYNYGNIWFCGKNIYALISSASTIAAGATFTVKVIDTDTWVSSDITMTNTTGKIIYLGQITYSIKEKEYIGGNDTYFIVRCSDNTGYAIKWDDCSEVTQLMFNGEALNIAYNTRYIFDYDDAAGNIYMCCAENATTTYKSYIIKNDLSVKIINQTSEQYSNRSNIYIPVKNQFPLCLRIVGSNATRPIVPCFHCDFLTTKMNLDAPVTKTGDMVMKVTYTIKS